MGKKAIEKQQPDVTVFDSGSVLIIVPHTPMAVEWVDANVNLDSWQLFGGGFACESRYVGNLLNTMEIDGLKIG